MLGLRGWQAGNIAFDIAPLSTAGKVAVLDRSGSRLLVVDTNSSTVEAIPLSAPQCLGDNAVEDTEDNGGFFFGRLHKRSKFKGSASPCGPRLVPSPMPSGKSDVMIYDQASSSVQGLSLSCALKVLSDRERQAAA